MIRPILICLTLLAAASAGAQIRATTSDGKGVLLYPDGTWKFGNQSAVAQSLTGSRSATATAKLDLWGGPAAIYYDPAKWHVTKADSPGRTTLEHAKGDAYAMIIAERIAIPLDTLRKIAIANARSASADATVAAERRLRVNGTDILEMRINGTIQGVQFVYLGYYYSGASGSVQVLTYTGANLFDEFHPDFQEFLNGFVVR